MTALKPTCGPGVGLHFANQDVTVINRTAATLTPGEIVMFDLADTDAGTTTTTTEGAEGSTFANVITPTTAGIGTLSGASPAHPGYFFGVVIVGGADDAKVTVRVRGTCKASITATAATIGVGLSAANAVRTLTAGITAGNKTLAILREANGSAAGLYEVLFDGINGFGTWVQS